MLQIFNSLTMNKEVFIPIDDKGVRMYVCGVTVYDLCHIGHARSAVAFDTIRRGLEWLGFPVIFVKNYTDIDDKIIKKANDTGKNWQEITAEFITKHDQDMDAIGVKRPTHAPKATDFIPQMVAFIKRLIENGNAYEKNGDVYFRVKSFDGYGKLSHKNIDDLVSGSRVTVNEAKENPLDFVLWKSSKPDEPSWDSPWGKGRPGWHIECSVMSEALLGIPIDIHGGGHDLIFPHHENEIAQSEAACGCEFAHFWVHNGFINIDREKMSKSLGNFLTIRDIIKEIHPEVLRFFLLTTHYRQPLEFSFDKLYEAETALDRIYTYKDELNHAVSYSDGKDLTLDIDKAKIDFDREFATGIKDDFNTPIAIAAVFDFIRAFNKILSSKLDELSLSHLHRVSENFFLDLKKVLNIGRVESSQWFKMKLQNLSPEEIDILILERKSARDQKDFKKADEIRAKLTQSGVELIDTEQGTRYRTHRVRAAD